jgi:hypothetical protein
MPAVDVPVFLPAMLASLTHEADSPHLTRSRPAPEVVEGKCVRSAAEDVRGSRRVAPLASLRIGLPPQVSGPFSASRPLLFSQNFW